MLDASQAFTFSYAALWVLVVIQSLLLLGLVRMVDQLREEGTSVPRLQHGQLAPSFSAVDIWGGAINNEDFVGRLTALLFVSPTCASCSLTLKELEGLRFKAEGNVIVVCQADRTDCLGLAERYGLGMPMITDADNELGHLFDIRGVPTAVLIDAQGHIQSIGQPTRAEELEEMIAERVHKPEWSEVGSGGVHG